jgi:hypothetical protein
MMEVGMSLQLRSALTGVALMLLGIAALFCGVKWLAILVPVALLVYSSVGHPYKGNRRV